MRNQFTGFIAASTILVSLGCTTAQAQDISGPTLRELGNKLGIYVGYQGNWGIYSKLGPARILSTEANISVNSDYIPSGTWTGPDSYDWTLADRSSNFARQFGTSEIAYLFPMPNFTGGYYQSWFTEPKTDWTPEQLQTMLDNYIGAAMNNNETKGDSSAALWVVVNEALHQGQGGYQFPGNSQWRKMGWDAKNQMPVFLKRAFDSAARVRGNNTSKKLLYLDEGNAAGGEIHTERCYQMLASLKRQGAAVDGVGLQMHMKYNPALKRLENDKGEAFDFEAFGPALQRYADLGLNIYIAELDIEMPDGQPQTMKLQADLFRQIVRRALQQPKFKSLILWGTNDLNNWKQGGHAHIFDENDERKPAYYAVREEMERALVARRAGAPVLNLAPGRYYENRSVRLSTSVAGAKIRYTTDGSTPTATHGLLYSQPISVRSNTTIRAITLAQGQSQRPITAGRYLLSSTLAPPVFRAQFGGAGSIYEKRRWVDIASATPNAKIRYTTDGSNPSPSHGTLYDGTAAIVDVDKGPVTLRALAYRIQNAKREASAVAHLLYQ